MSAVKLNVAVEKLRLAAPFRISGYVMEEQDVIVVELRDGGHRGRGEASGVYYLGDTAEKLVAQIEAHRDAIEAGIDRASLQQLLPPGGARNAVDCALWELERIPQRRACVETGWFALAEPIGHHVHIGR